MKWAKKGFEDFRKGSFGNAGQNLYVTANGTLQRIFNFDVNSDGYVDIPIANSHSMNERPPLYVYDRFGQEKPLELPTHCSNAVTIQDFNGDGLLDIYGTAYNNGRCRDIDSKMYFQSADRMFHLDNFMDIFNHSGCGCMAGDFNDDGYIDLAVASHKAYGNHVTSSYIFWGGPDGINEQRYTELPSRGPHGMCSVDIGNIMDRSDSEYYTSESDRIHSVQTGTGCKVRLRHPPCHRSNH